jgi:hypothetical protein
MSTSKTLFVSWAIRLGCIALVAVLNAVLSALSNGSLQLPIPAALDTIIGTLIAEFVDWLIPYEGNPASTVSTPTQ